MTFAVGYQLPEEDEEPLVDVVRDFLPRIGEVYFPWLDMPSGRSPMTAAGGLVDWEGQARLEQDLRRLKHMGVRLDLLFNAACYGRHGMSRHLANLVCSTIAHLQQLVGLDLVTTTSPMIAGTVKQHFPDIEVRASVNMRIGTVKGMEYVADRFDSFTMQREYNRDLGRISELREWCDAHGKGLSMLANSGCLSFCSAQTFHDNLVAHESEVSETVNLSDTTPALCWDYYRDTENWVTCLQNSWIRPEDIKRYEAAFPLIKLATRMHANPRRVVEAYCTGQFEGNLLDLLEPGHGPVLAPYTIDNARFPADWFERTTSCDRRCQSCDYCASVLQEVLVSA
jgi:collagenase-like PrtC family protease